MESSISNDEIWTSSTETPTISTETPTSSTQTSTISTEMSTNFSKTSTSFSEASTSSTETSTSFSETPETSSQETTNESTQITSTPIEEPTSTISSTLHSTISTPPVQTTGSSISTEIESTEKPPPCCHSFIELNCMSSGQHLTMPISNISFSISPLTPQSVIVRFEKNSGSIILFYYETLTENFEWDSVHCSYVGDSSTNLIENLEPEKLYMFCAAYNDDPYYGLYSCRAHQMPLAYDSQCWLTNGKKSLVASLLAASIIIAILFGMTVTYFLIYNVPTLLRGNKRVVMVKKHSKSVMVLPNISTISRESESQCNSNSDSRKSSERSLKKIEQANYMTPAPVPRLAPPR